MGGEHITEALTSSVSAGLFDGVRWRLPLLKMPSFRGIAHFK